MQEFNSTIIQIFNLKKTAVNLFQEYIPGKGAFTD